MPVGRRPIISTIHFYPSKNFFRLNCVLPQQIACPPDGHAMPGDFVAVNRLGAKLKFRD